MNHNKKLLIILLVLNMALHIGAGVPDVQTKDVMATYEDTTQTVYQVDVSWGSLAFTYRENKGTWDPAKGEYTGERGEWVAEENANKISVTNRSNASVTAELSFAATGTVTADFYTDNAKSAKSVFPQTLDTSEEMTSYLCITGGTISEDQKIGSVTLEIGKGTGENAPDDAVVEDNDGNNDANESEPLKNQYQLTLGNYQETLTNKVTTFTYTPANDETLTMTIGTTHTCYDTGDALMIAPNDVGGTVKTFSLSADTTYTFTVMIEEQGESLAGGIVQVSHQD